MPIHEPIPVLLLVRELGLGGSERQLAETAQALDPHRFMPHVGCMREGFRAAGLRAVGIPVTVFPVRSLRRPSAIAGAWQLACYLKRHKIRIAHAFDVPMDLFAVPTARLAGTPVVVSSRRAFSYLTPGVQRRLLRFADRLAHGIVVNGEAIRRHLIEDEAVPEHRVYLCYNSIDHTEFALQPRPSRPELTIGIVGALRPEKDVATLIRAFAQSRQPHWRLIIVGSGPCLTELEQLSRHLALAQSVRFHPTTERVSAWLHQIDIFVLPSLSEAFSNSLMEAMACGCTVVASRIGGNPELVIQNETGLLFEAGQSQDLAAALLRLSEDASLRRRLAAGAIELVRRRFSRSATGRRMQEIYESLLNAGAPESEGD